MEAIIKFAFLTIALWTEDNKDKINDENAQK